MVRAMLLTPLLAITLAACSGPTPDEIRKAAENGNAVAQTKLGISYLESNPQQPEQALVWFRKAAAQEHSPAQALLGAMYKGGLGVQRDYNQAITWYKKAAEHGNAPAQYSVFELDSTLGLLKITGYSDSSVAAAAQKYIPLSPRENTFWLRKSAENGYAEAQRTLGFKHLIGTETVAHDCQQGQVFLRKASKQGDKTARKILDEGGKKYGCDW